MERASDTASSTQPSLFLNARWVDVVPRCGGQFKVRLRSMSREQFVAALDVKDPRGSLHRILVDWHQVTDERGRRLHFSRDALDAVLNESSLLCADIFGAIDAKLRGDTELLNWQRARAASKDRTKRAQLARRSR